MDELEISGKRYISSKRAAKENRYHVDYIGQLIRSGKILGSKVGRTWYVETESLNTYLGQEHVATTAPVIAKNYVPTISLKAKEQTKKIEVPQEDMVPKQSMRLPASSLTYIQDDEPLLPRPVRSEGKIEIKRVVESNKTTVAQSSQQAAPAFATVGQVAPRSNVSMSAAIFVGVVVLALSAGLSYFLHLDTTVDASNTYTSVHF